MKKLTELALEYRRGLINSNVDPKRVEILYNGVCDFINTKLDTFPEAEKAQITHSELWDLEIEVNKDFGVEQYEMRGDEGDYTPNEREKFLIHDFHAGFMEEYVDLLCAKFRPAKVSKDDIKYVINDWTSCGESRLSPDDVDEIAQAIIDRIERGR